MKPFDHKIMRNPLLQDLLLYLDTKGAVIGGRPVLQQLRLRSCSYQVLPFARKKTEPMRRKARVKSKEKKWNMEIQSHMESYTF